MERAMNKKLCIILLVAALAFRSVFIIGAARRVYTMAQAMIYITEPGTYPLQAILRHILLEQIR